MEASYLNLLRDCLMKGQPTRNRTGIDTLARFGAQMRFDLYPRFPLLTTKKVHTRSIIHELLWFLKGDTNIKYLQDHKVRIWDEWADKNGDLGPVYGEQWRSWRGPGKLDKIDQIAEVIESIRTNPRSRRHIVSAWNVGELDDMALPPCHLLFQFHVSVDNRLSCQLYQRSADMFLGVPFNIASYALLTCMIAQVTGYAPGEFIHTLGDYHVYTNHLGQCAEQLARVPYTAPKLWLNPEVREIDDFKFDDIQILEYTHHPAIKATVAV